MATGPMQLVDIGVNLTHKSFAADLPAVMQRARAAGVFRQVVTGTEVAASHAACALAEAYPGELFATAGVHPHHAREVDTEAMLALEALAAKPCVVAIGECGLDYNRDFSPRDVQREAFARQLELAARLGLPVFMHERDAHDDFCGLVREQRAALGAVVVHCFTGDPSQLANYLALDCHIGVTGWVCDERRGHALSEAVPNIPSDRLMVESDAPYLLPRSIERSEAVYIRGRRNEPALLPWVVRRIAELRGQSPAAVAQLSRRTSMRFFDLGES